MVELSQKRLEVRRERVGFNNEQPRNNNATPANVTEAVSRLRELEERHKAHRNAAKAEGADMTKVKRGQKEGNDDGEDEGRGRDRKLWKEGRIVHRTETDLKTHTSYLVFAVLPREWTGEDEARCREKWPVTSQSMEDEAKQPKVKKVKT